MREQFHTLEVRINTQGIGSVHLDDREIHTTSLTIDSQAGELTIVKLGILVSDLDLIVACDPELLVKEL